MNKFVDFQAFTCSYRGPGSVGICFSLDNIIRIIKGRIPSMTNIITKDRKIYTINESYDDVIKKIRKCEKSEEDGEC